jgi:hypothetical protein
VDELSERIARTAQCAAMETLADTWRETDLNCHVANGNKRVKMYNILLS